MVLHQTVLFAEDRNPIDKARHISYFVESECKMQLVNKPKQTYLILPNMRITENSFKFLLGFRLEYRKKAMNEKPN